ncbi:hypothetical protein Osc7112_6401 (plasmid) [Oscillatoria nigro-viridis PCC 7112]|uniref:Uncharacterized protein n=2 Tax=Phormidium nigroviride TaxID=482564 RepID=K9VR61_9CYAN|nr:hypothetical protein Osc7112_6401 [Oscillatoria nigro-viridis PCC 7112]
MLHHVVNCCNLKKVSNAYREKFDWEFSVNMTIQTINDVLFPPFLFTTLFCLASVFLHKPEAAQEELTDNRTQVNVSTVATPSDGIGSAVNGATIEIEKPASSHHTRHQTTGKKTPNKPAKPIDFAAHSGASTTSVPAVNTSLISLRQARKIASAIKAAAPELGFKQKVNGSDSSIEWLQAQIKNRLENSPLIVMPIILKLAPKAVIANTLASATSLPR